MRKLYPFVVIYVGLMLTSCSAIRSEQPVDLITTSEKTTTKTTVTQPYVPHCKSCKKIQNPAAVSFYTDPASLPPKKPYKVIGKATVSKYNYGGIKRQEGVIHDAMRNLTASVGGDAVIDIKPDDKTVTGTVIAFPDEVA